MLVVNSKSFGLPCVRCAVRVLMGDCILIVVGAVFFCYGI
jgi:hypothetical protein